MTREQVCEWYQGRGDEITEEELDELMEGSTEGEEE
jgi:hypothetical protein